MKLKYLICLVLVASVILTGCGGTKETAKEETTKKVPEKTTYRGNSDEKGLQGRGASCVQVKGRKEGGEGSLTS